MNSFVHSPLKLHFSICTCCILFWSLARFYVHLWIETENRIKLPSHNTGQVSHQSASCLKNQSLAGFWMLHKKNRLKFSLGHYFSWWPLLTAVPKQLMMDPIFWLRNQSCIHSLEESSFFLELNHDTHTIWYQIDQCHFAFTAESLVPYLKLCALLIQTRIFSTSYWWRINQKKAFHRMF